MRKLAMGLLVLGLGCATATTASPGGSEVAPGADEAAPATATTATAAADDAPSGVVYLVRHAEKAKDGTQDPPLTEAGQRRADCLARVLGDAGVTHLFATELQRTQNTVGPLGAATGLKTEVIEAGKGDALVAALDGLPPGSVAVVAGHSNTIPAIAAALGSELSGLDEQGYIEHSTYDRLDVLVRGPTPTRLQLHYCDPSPKDQARPG